MSNDYQYWDEEKGEWVEVKERNKKNRNELVYKQLPRKITNCINLIGLYWGGSINHDIFFKYNLEKLSILSSLKKIKHLSLSFNQIKKIQDLNNLNQLKSLDLSYNQIMHIEGLDKLPKLESLNLNDNQIRKIQGLNNLNQLKSLDLSYNQIMHIEGLDKLPKLESLSLYHNKIFSLKNLPNSLVKIFISKNKLHSLRGMPKLDKLKHLDLSKNSLASLKGMSKLNKLEDLILSSNRLSSLKGMPILKNLEYLDLNFNRLTSLQDMPKLSNLQYLLAVGNKLKSFTNPQKIYTFRCLFLAKNKITFLSLDTVAKSTDLRYLAINNNQIQNILQEFLNNQEPVIPYYFLPLDMYDNSISIIRSYATALQKGNTPDNTVKLIFVGNGLVGKTCIAKVLQGEEFPKAQESTHGITIAQWQPKDTETKFSLWDFGGQEIYHTTHRLFLNQNALYVLVWAKETEEDKNEARHPIQYWLDYIQDLGKGSPIILVENQIDKNNDQSNPIPDYASIMEDYNIVASTAISAKTGSNIEVLEAIMKAQAKFIITKRQYKIPLTWQKLQYRLIQARDKGAKRLTHQEYITIAQKEDIETGEADTILLYLHRSGFLYHQSNAFNSTIILDQNWAIDAVYKIFDRNLPHEKYIKTQGGYFSKAYAYNTIWQNTPNEEVDIYLDFIQSCEIGYTEQVAYAEEEHWQEYEYENTQYLIPQFLPPHPSRQCKRNWKNIGSEGLYLRLEHRFFHLAVLQRFIIRAAHLAENYGFWQKGIWITDEKNDVEALIDVVEMGQSESGYSLYQIQIRTSGQTEKNDTFLQQILNEFKKIRSSNLTIWLSIDGEQFVEESILQKQHQLGNTQIECQCETVVPINTFDTFLKYRSNIEGLKHSPPKNIVILHDSEDDVYLKKLHTRLGRWERRKKITIWDTTKITGGETIATAINQHVKNADIVLLLVSSHFLDNDMFYNFTESIQKRSDSRLIPIIIRPCLHKEYFGHLQVLPQNGIPISKWKDEDEAWLAVTEGLWEVV